MSWFRPAGYSLACLFMGLFGASAIGAPPNTGPNPSSGGFNKPKPSGDGVSLPKASQGGSSTPKPSSPPQSKPQLPKPNGPTVKKPTLPKPNGSTTVKKPTLPKPGGSSTVKKPTLPKPGGNTTVKRPTLPKPKLTANQKLQRQNLASRTLATKQREKLAKLNATERAKHQKAIQEAMKHRLTTRRPNTLVKKDVTKVKVDQTNKDKSKLALSDRNRKTLERSVKDKALLDRLKKNQLTAADRRLLEGRLRDARRGGNLGLFLSLKQALVLNTLIRTIGNVLSAMILANGPGGGGFIPLGPGWPGLTLIDPSSGASVEPPPGVDPGAPANLIPEVPGEPEGAGVVTSVDPESVDQPADGDTAAEAGEETVPVDGVVQSTRNLRLSNGCKKKIKIKIFYTTVNASNEVAEGEAELEPGEVVDLQEGEWTVNASSVRFTAEDEDGERKWERFKDTPLNLVPEDDGYVASKPQTLVLALR